jgi:hypothetical protein
MLEYAVRASKPLAEPSIACANGFRCNCLQIQNLRAMKQLAVTPVKIESVIESCGWQGK